MRVTDLPDPQPKAAEYLIEVHAAAANFFDILQVQGKYQQQPRTHLACLLPCPRPRPPPPFLPYRLHQLP